MDFAENCISKSHFLFKHLNNSELDLVLSQKKEGIHKRGDVLYNEGNRIKGIYCINSGIIKLFKTGIDGKEQILRFASAGEIIGYRSVLSSELACTTSEVINEATSNYIPGEILIDLIKNNGDFALELLQMTCRELGEANSYITDIAQKTAKERLAEILIHLKNEFGVDKNGILKISLTREELANIVGTATESIIRMLSEFKHDKLLEINGRNIKIIDYSSLNNISNSFY